MGMPFLGAVAFAAAMGLAPAPQQHGAPALAPHVVHLVTGMFPTALKQTPFPIELMVNGHPFVIASTSTRPVVVPSSVAQPEPQGSPDEAPARGGSSVMGDFPRGGGSVMAPLVQGGGGIDVRGRGENLRDALEQSFPQLFDPARHVPHGDGGQGEHQTGDGQPQPSSAPDTPPDPSTLPELGGDPPKANPSPVAELGGDPPKVDNATVGSGVSAPPVPEPSTWMMMMLGFVAAGRMYLTHRKPGPCSEHLPT